MKRKIIIFLALSVLILSSIYFYKKFQPIQQDTKTFVIGTAAGYAPFASINAQGDYEGFDIDIANSLAQELDKQLVIKDLGSMAPLFIALEQGSIDAIIWGLSITQERLNKVAMIRYAGEQIISYPLIFWEKIPASITSINDMRTMTIAAEPASAQERVLRKYSFITIKPTEKIDDALLNIQYGKADAAFVEQAIANKFKKIYPQIQILEVPLVPEDQVVGIGIAIKKENTALINQIQAAIDQLNRDNRIKQLEQKWNIQ